MAHKTEIQIELEKLEETVSAISLWTVPYLSWFECYQKDGRLRIFDICSAFNCCSIGEMLVANMRPLTDVVASAVGESYTHVNYGLSARGEAGAPSVDEFMATFAGFHGLRVAAKLVAARINDPNIEIIHRLLVRKLLQGQGDVQ